MIIYVLISNGDGNNILGIYSTLEKATTSYKTYKAGFIIEAWETDTSIIKELYMYWDNKWAIHQDNEWKPIGK